MHDSAVQTLEAVAGGRFTDLAVIAARARAEADLLERELSAASAPASLSRLVADVIAAHPALHVTLDSGGPVALPTGVARAVAAACSEALTNVAKHSGTSEAKVVVRSEGTGVRLVVEDRGVGFEGATRGFGMTHSIEGRMAEQGGAADIRSVPGTGTTVTLRWPA